MRPAAKYALGLCIVAGIALGLFLLPVVPISVGYVCNGGPACAELSMSTFASVTYASFHVGEVYVRDNSDGSFSRYCWMEGNPLDSPYGTLCGYAVG